MFGNSETSSDPLVQALEEQVVCYQRLAKLAELQHVHVQQNQTEALLDVLRRRQLVLDEIAKFERQISSAKQSWSQYVGSLHKDQRARAEMLLAETRQLLEQITAADQNDAMVLQQRKLNLGKQINQTASARQINRTYAAAAYGTKPSRMNVRQ